MKRLSTGFLSLCFVVLLTSSAMAANVTCSNGVWYRMLLGTGVGQPVTQEEIAAFIDTVLTEQLLEEMTIIEISDHQNSNDHGLIKKHATVVDIQCPDTEDNFTKIRKIARMYTKQFVRAKASCYVKRIPGVNTFLYCQ